MRPGWVVLANKGLVFYLCFTAPNQHPSSSPPSIPSRLYKAYFPNKNNQQKQNSINLMRPSCGLQESASPIDMWSPLLKYPGSIFIWRRSRSWKLASFHWQVLHKLVLFLSSFWGEWTCSIGFRNASRILASTNLKKRANGMQVKSRDFRPKQKTERLFKTIRQPESILKNQSPIW